MAYPLVDLREARRVTRSGAVIGLCDSDWDAESMYPSTDVLRHAHDVGQALREAAGTSPRVGRQLRDLLPQAGFAGAKGFALCGSYADPDSVQRHWLGRLHDSRLADLRALVPSEAALFVKCLCLTTPGTYRPADNYSARASANGKIVDLGNSVQ